MSTPGEKLGAAESIGGRKRDSIGGISVVETCGSVVIGVPSVLRQVNIIHIVIAISISNIESDSLTLQLTSLQIRRIIPQTTNIERFACHNVTGRVSIIHAISLASVGIPFISVINVFIFQGIDTGIVVDPREFATL